MEMYFNNSTMMYEYVLPRKGVNRDNVRLCTRVSIARGPTFETLLKLLSIGAN